MIRVRRHHGGKRGADAPATKRITLIVAVTTYEGAAGPR